MYTGVKKLYFIFSQVKFNFLYFHKWNLTFSDIIYAINISLYFLNFFLFINTYTGSLHSEHFAGPALGPICLPRFSVDGKSKELNKLKYKL